MITFVDIRGQGTGFRFAFFDTTRNRFCEFDDEQVWDTESEFAEAFERAGGVFADPVRVSGIDRFTELMPEWVKTPAAEDDDL